jgi:hypothetical protein
VGRENDSFTRAYSCGRSPKAVLVLPIQLQQQRQMPKLRSLTPIMTPYEEAQAVARRVGLDFHTALAEHHERGFVWSSPDCFILAMEAWKDFELPTAEPAIFVTLACGDIGQFLRLDPKPEARKWLAFARHDGGEAHWIPYARLRAQYLKNENSTDSQK